MEESYTLYITNYAHPNYHMPVYNLIHTMVVKDVGYVRTTASRGFLYMAPIQNLGVSIFNDNPFIINIHDIICLN